jgi:2-polyprenyl-3-methyl-5-hydroxy-6-metoxy-1,4-benzoquinol methylase
MADTPEWRRVAERLRAQAESRERPRELHGAVLQLAGRLAGGRVLDIGCGDGALVRVLARRGARVEGVDPSPERVRNAERLAREAGIVPVPRFAVGDPHNLASLPAGPFDLITALLALDPAAKPITELRGLAKRLRPGGRLILAFAHPYRSGAAQTRPLEALFGSLRDVGLRAVDLVEPVGDDPEQRYLAVLCERRGRRPRRKRG